MSSGTHAARERRWNPPVYAFQGFETDVSQDAICSELTAGVLPQEIATRARVLLIRNADPSEHDPVAVLATGTEVECDLLAARSRRWRRIGRPGANRGECRKDEQG
jgi:hypothetical protein